MATRKKAKAKPKIKRRAAPAAKPAVRKKAAAPKKKAAPKKRVAPKRVAKRTVARAAPPKVTLAARPAAVKPSPAPAPAVAAAPARKPAAPAPAAPAPTAPAPTAPAPTAPAPAAPAPAQPEGDRVGVVTHYYGHLSVAAVKLETGRLRVGDRIRIKGHTSDFIQRVESLQVEHRAVTEVGPNDDFALKVNHHAREHDVVYKLAR
jgi:hypothetical protein